MWSVNIRNSAKSDFIICKDYNIQPSEIYRLPYFKYEWLLEDITELRKAEEAERKRQERENKRHTPTKTPSVSLPKVSMPRF